MRISRSAPSVTFLQGIYIPKIPRKGPNKTREDQTNLDLKIVNKGILH